MPVLLVRYEVAAEGAAEIVAAVKAAFDALEALQPKGVRYAYMQRAAEFIALLELEEGVENPLPGIEEARQLQATVAKWAAVAPQPFEVLGTYRMFS